MARTEGGGGSGDEPYEEKGKRIVVVVGGSHWTEQAAGCSSSCRGQAGNLAWANVACHTGISQAGKSIRANEQMRLLVGWLDFSIPVQHKMLQNFLSPMLLHSHLCLAL